MALRAVKRNSKSKSRRAAARYWMRRLALGVVVAAVVVLITLLASGYAVSRDAGCWGCHPAYIETAPSSSHGGVECAECHASHGGAAYVVDGLRAMHWLAESSPETVAPSGFDDDRCIECHEDIFEGVVENRGIAVSHADFEATLCTQCHNGIAHEISGRWYRSPEMDDCVECHRTSPTNADSCNLCHVPDPSAERREGNTVWRATHGRGWQKTHGMGDLDMCKACHAPVYCIDCHGVRIPHSQDWLGSHGGQVVVSGRAECETCHESSWCDSCHQVEMPHPDTFLLVHEPQATELGRQLCYRCHVKEACDACHQYSQHLQVPEVQFHEFE